MPAKCECKLVVVVCSSEEQWAIAQLSPLGLSGTDMISGKLIVSKYVTESITMIAGRFGHEGLCQLRTELYKGLHGQNVLQSLLLILLRIC